MNQLNGKRAVGLLTAGIVIGAIAWGLIGAMLKRGQSAPGIVASATSQPAAAAVRKIKYYWDPMLSPPYISDKPGISPMGMELIPVYEDDVSAGPTVTIDPVVAQNIGIRVAEVRRGRLDTTVRAVGYVRQRSGDRREINLRVSGWIQKLYADTEGMAVRKGDALFELYSPELTVAIEEMIAARRALEPPPADAAARDDAQLLLQASRRKLELMGLDAAMVADLAKLDRAPATVTFTSPIDGFVAEKMIFAGSAVKAGDVALRLADRSKMWLDVQIFPKDLQSIHEGQAVQATVEGTGAKTFDGRVIFIHPELDAMTRAALVRVELANPTLELRQNMFATARITIPGVGEAVIVPREAVIDTGERQIAFVVESDGRFAPRNLKLGAENSDGDVEILSGLAPGDKVVVSGQFLLDSESHLREAIQKQMDAQLLKPEARKP